jgi:4-hydroxymandelate oxidase
VGGQLNTTVHPAPRAITLADYEPLARTALDESAWAYLAGGAADEITLRDNRAAWDGWRLLPRVLRPLAGGHTRQMLLGREWPHPIMLAPVAYQRLFHPDGEHASALAAAAQGAGITLSTQASVAIEDVARLALGEAGRGALWFQLYVQHDRGFTRELVQRAEAAGYEALVVTVDAPTSGARDRERRAGFHLPPGVQAVNLAGLAPRPIVDVSAGQSALFDGLLHGAPTWADIEWLVRLTRLPVLLKGVLHADDAGTALSAGAAGLIVSNHGGRTLDTAISTAFALPRIADVVAGRMPLLVDGGIRRGTDIVKALALGAQAVMVGRPCIWALAAEGALGVARAIRLLRDEFEIALALCGCSTLRDVDKALLVASREA